MNTDWYSVKGNGKEFYCKVLTISAECQIEDPIGLKFGTQSTVGFLI